MSSLNSDLRVEALEAALQWASGRSIPTEQIVEAAGKFHLFLTAPGSAVEPDVGLGPGEAQPINVDAESKREDAVRLRQIAEYLLSPAGSTETDMQSAAALRRIAGSLDFESLVMERLEAKARRRRSAELCGND